ncbi:MAG: hypothetical protein ACRDRV_01850 [Pseudonocardiaceae bacterium]
MLPAHPFYGGPPVHPDVGARATVAQLRRDLDEEGTGHIKLIGGRFFDWIAAGKRVYTDASWSVGFAARWLVAEIERRGIGHDRLVFVSDEPWSDRAGEYAGVRAVVGDGELAEHVFSRTFETLYG